MTTLEWPIILIVNALLIVLLGIFVIWKIQRDRKSGYPMKDERTSKIQGKAAIGTFMISMLVLIIVGNEFLNLPELDAGWAVIAIMLVLGISFGLLSWYYAKNGDFR